MQTAKMNHKTEIYFSVMVHPSNIFVISIYISQLNPKTDIYVSVMIHPETSIKNEGFLIRGCERKKKQVTKSKLSSSCSQRTQANAIKPAHLLRSFPCETKIGFGVKSYLDFPG